MEVSVTIGLAGAIISSYNAGSSDESMSARGGHLPQEHASRTTGKGGDTLFWIWVALVKAHVLWREEAIIPKKRLRTPLWECQSQQRQHARLAARLWGQSHHLTLSNNVPEKYQHADKK